MGKIIGRAITEQEVMDYVDEIKYKYSNLSRTYLNGSEFDLEIIYDGCNYHNRCSVYYFISNDGGETNADGDLVYYFRVRPQVNYPSYGGDNPNIVEKRMELIKEAIEFAKEIGLKFPDRWGEIVQTKAELELIQEKRKEAELKELVTSWLARENNNIKGMRVLSTKTILSLDFHGKRNTTYDISLNKKSYTVIEDNNSIEITRTA